MVIEIYNDNHVKLFKYDIDREENYRISSNFFVEKLNKWENLLVLKNIYSKIFIILHSEEDYIYFINNLNCCFSDTLYLDKLTFYQIDDYNLQINNFYKEFCLIKNFKQICEIYRLLSSNSIHLEKNLNAIFLNPDISLKNNDYLFVKIIYLYSHKLEVGNDKLVQSSRFLRKYFENDNFILLSFIDNDRPMKSSNNNDFEEKLFSYVYNNGITIFRNNYKFFFIPTSRIRKSSFWLVSEEWLIKKKLTISDLYRELGYDKLSGEKSISLKIARISLNFTNTYEIHFEKLQLLIMKDIIKPSNNNDKPYIFTDGKTLII